jgi:hypothetical protein
MSEITEIDQWLDARVSGDYAGQPLAQDWARISKISEELGEATQAFIGYTAQNPRKGRTHDLAAVLDELCDTVLTGVFAIQHFTKDEAVTRKLIADKLTYQYERMMRSNSGAPR